MFIGAVASWGYAVVLDHRVERALEASAPLKAPDPVEAPEEEPQDDQTASETSGENPDAPSETEQPGQPPAKAQDPRTASSQSTPSLPDGLKEVIGEKHLFGRKVKVVQAKVQMIIGNTALINGQPMVVGEEKGGVKLIEIVNADKVIIEIDGKRQEKSIWANVPGLVSSGSPPIRGTSRETESRRGERGRSERGRGGFEMRWGGDLSPEQTERMQEFRERMRDMRRSGNFDPEEFRQMREEMGIEGFGGGGRRGRRGGR